MRNKLSRRAFLGWVASGVIGLAGCQVAPAMRENTSDEPYRAKPLSLEDANSPFTPLSEEEWQALMSPLQFKVMRQKGTERAFTGEYDGFKADGIYHCAACGNPLFDSHAKYDSGTGWPSYWMPIREDVVLEEKDSSLGMNRVEVLCARCESHLGHVFTDGPQPTGLRYCMNSIALNFAPTTES